MSKIVSTVGAELAAIRKRFEDADQRLLRAGTSGTPAERAQAQDERDAALGEHYGAAVQLADLLLLLVRYAVEYRRDALLVHLGGMVCEIVEPELRPLAKAIAARLEARK